MANLANLTINSTQFIDLPVGNTAQRPIGPANGTMRFNTTGNYFEFYNGSTWQNINVAATTNLTGTATIAIGAGGAAGNAANGSNGGATTFTYSGVTIRANGGLGGIFNQAATAEGGNTANAFVSANGGSSTLTSTGEFGAAGGGGVGGGNTSTGGETNGTAGGSVVDTANLFIALTAQSISTTAPSGGLGSNAAGTANGADSTGFGCGGGGAGSNGGIGGNGFRGGGGGGASGFSANGLVNYRGGAGGNGAIVVKRITNNAIAYETLTSGTSWSVPANTTGIMIWCVGGGGGGAGANSGNSGTGGGAGGIASYWFGTAP